ncbi:FtsH protease activity modulator HflK [Marinimicrobium sp. LS-A18]|uniref:FtsH protease activity modulator HflK n=1 Tax=Marinimicrobium sp. LS-A18 TaxID=1381596 RepID=UPI0004635C7C|nr:FtsH protease activity modulator HflK [Marinimicrobium sp. LS-A18]
MAWNEPGGGGKDPWGGGNNSGPPDLDEAWKKFRDRLNGLFGGSGGGSGSGGGNAGSAAPLVGIVLLVAAAIYFVLGFYVVDARERAVVLQFGAFHEIKDPGLRWNAPLITTVFVENVTEERQYPSRGLMLTQDESIVELPITVQYNVNDVKAYVLNVRDPENSLRQAADSALRHVVGSSELNEVLSGGRSQIAEAVQERLQNYLNSYGTGIDVREVNIQEARPPEEVRDAFDDVIKAKEDEERLKNEAQAYANSVIPQARGEAQRMIEEAEAYRARVVAEAEGESRRFELLMAEFDKAPEVTRRRLYIDAVEEVFSKASKVMVDVEGGSNMLYLPLDRLNNRQSGNASGSAGQSGMSADTLREVTEQVTRELNRRPSNTVRTDSRGDIR